MLDKTFEPDKLEAKQYENWEQSGCFSANPSSNKSPYTIMMPPPNVTGSLHMGHALNMTLQDILTRFARMKDKDAMWMPGTDHAGIATQMVVERKLESEGQSRKALGREEFINKVWEWKAYSGGTITRQLRRLGTSPDWTRERFTMDSGLSNAVTKTFVKLYKDGLMYRDKRLVNWDPKFHTAISDLEVEQKEQKSKLWHIRYPMEGEKEQFIIVATTRPETMFGDTAIAVHPEDARYKDLIGKYAVLPVVGRMIPIVADEYADPEQGSGAVKITPAHDFNDFEVGKRHNLEMVSVLDINACINENGPDGYVGLDRYDARKKLLAELEDMDLIEAVDDHTNVLPYGDRSGVVIEPMLTDQWYVDAPTLAKKAISAVEDGRTEFVPKQWENTYYAWMRDIQPWCVSRQLWWGHQIPAWYGPDGEVFVAETEEEAIAQAKDHYGEDVMLERDADVLDTWFSSALWPFSTLGWPESTEELKKYYPGDVLITGFDIIFFWVARMMMMGLYLMDDVPFKKVYIHALVRDAKGQKMSKSKGNVIDPLELVDQYGADALRFTLCAMAAMGRDIRLSEKRVEGYRNFATKLWNAARYCEMNGCEYGSDFDPAKVEQSVNQWIISEVQKTADKIETALNNYRFNDAADAIYHFVWGGFCDWYLEFTKPLINGDDEAVRHETRATTAWALNKILLLLNPFMPYVTEALHKSMFAKNEDEHLMTMAWPRADGKFEFPEASEEIQWLCDLISEIRSVRTDMKVPASAKLSLLVKDAGLSTVQRMEKYDDLIRMMARLETIRPLSGEPPKGAIQTVLHEATLLLPIADIIDLDQERGRLKKEIARLSKDIKQIDAKLGNQGFLSNAPEEVIEEQKSRKAEAQTALDKFQSAFSQIENV